MPNIDLLEATMAHIVAHPEQHVQGTVWWCGTPACFVGHAMAQKGLTFEEYRQMITQTEVDSLDWAEQNFGLTYDEVCVLFHPVNTIPMLQAMVKDAANDGTLKPWQQYSEEAGVSY